MKCNTGKHHHFSRFNPRAANLFTIHNKSVHSERRRCIGRAFTHASIERFESRLISHINNFCNQIGSAQKAKGTEWTEALKMSDWAGYLIFDTLTDFLLGQEYNLLKDISHRPIIHHVKCHIIRPAVCAYIPLLAVFKIDKLLFREAAGSTRALWRWVKCAIAKRTQRSSGPRDVFDQIQLSRKSEPSSTIEIQSETGMFIVAGLDTTATALCALLFYLSRSQRAYQRLCGEIRSTFTYQEHIRLGQRLKSCSFLHACINEALRMSPPVGSSPWRVVGLGGEVIAGLAIPQGCSVGTGVYSMHHNDRYFENPHEFIPERWLQDPHRRGSGNMTLNPAFMPFSTGPRSCIGQSLATAEVSLTVAILLWRYDLRAGNAGDHDIGGGKAVSGKENVGRTNPEEFQLIDRVLGLPQGPELEFRPRSVSQA